MTAAEIWNKPALPILTGTQAWEKAHTGQGQVGEPAVVRPEVSASGKWEIFYQAGWNSSQIGKAVCEGGDPENPAHWVKRTLPVVGTLAGNFWASAAHHDVIVIDDVYHLYFTTTNTAGANIWLATSPDGETFTVRRVPVILTGSEDQVMGNSALFIEGDTLYNFYDAISKAPGSVWKTYLATAPIDKPWQFTKHRSLPTLQVGTGVYGGQNVRKIGNHYHTWAINGPAGLTPSYIYHHYSYEAVNWGVLNGGNPVLTLTSASEGDQISDPDVQDNGSNALMFYATVNNPIAEGRIWVARLNGPLSSLALP